MAAKKPEAGKADQGKKPAASAPAPASAAKSSAGGAADDDDDSPISQYDNSPKSVMNAMSDLMSGNTTFGEVLGITADQAYNLAEMGYRLLQEGQLDDAEVMFRGLVTLNPHDAYMHLALGSVYHRSDRSKDAIEQYTKAIDLAADMTNAYANRGELYLAQGDAEKGLKDLKKALELDPKGEDPCTIRARAIIATAAAKIKEKGLAGAKGAAAAKPAAPAAGGKKK
jgi:Flp pilus assembly protein TadD